MVCMPDMKFYRACIFFLYKEILSTRRKHRDSFGMEVKWNTNIESTQ